MKHLLLAIALAAAVVPANVFALPAASETAHVVEPGETLNGIANRARVSRDSIIEANGLEPPYIIRIGQTLKIPRAEQTASRTQKTASRVIAARKAASSLTESGSYVVQPGDTLGGIALRAEIPRVLIAEANGIAPPYTIRVGQNLLLPRTRRHKVEPGETGFAIAYRYAVPWEQIAIANGLDADASLPSGKLLLIPTVVNPPTVSSSLAAAPPPAASPSATARFSWPVAGPVRRGFRQRGSGNYHDGVDIAAPRGTAVRAVDAGAVIFARKEAKQFGYLVVVDHGDGWHSAYGSLSRVTVKEGHKVSKGERVGLVGDTSVTRRTELHFELRKNGKPIDPVDELPAAP